MKPLLQATGRMAAWCGGEGLGFLLGPEPGDQGPALVAEQNGVTENKTCSLRLQSNAKKGTEKAGYGCRRFKIQDREGLINKKM